MPVSTAMDSAVMASTLTTSNSSSSVHEWSSSELTEERKFSTILGSIIGAIVGLFILSCIVRYWLDRQSKKVRQQRERESEDRMRGIRHGTRQDSIAALSQVRGETKEAGVLREEKEGRFRRWVWKVTGM